MGKKQSFGFGIKPADQEVKPVEIPVKPLVEDLPKITPFKKEVVPVKYREVVYLGVSEIAKRIGAVTGTEYVFTKDSYRMPVATQINERDYPAIITEKGKGCARRSPEILFMSKVEWDLELEQARVVNS